VSRLLDGLRALFRPYRWLEARRDIPLPGVAVDSSVPARQAVAALDAVRRAYEQDRRIEALERALVPFGLCVRSYDVEAKVIRIGRPDPPEPFRVHSYPGGAEEIGPEEPDP
jgi:hypothetical protein